MLRPPLLATTTALLLAAGTAVAQPAPSVLPGGDLLAAQELPGAPGPAGNPAGAWMTRGPLPAAATSLPDGTPALRLSSNTTLVSPEIDVPAGAQTVGVRARSLSGSALLVRAEPVDGTPGISLGVVEPDAAAEVQHVPVAAVAGRRVRLVLDPSTALGAAVDVSDVGPFAAPLPGWDLLLGAPSLAPGTGRRALLVRGDPARLQAPPAVLPAGVGHLLVAARGPGTLRLWAGAAVTAARLRAGWQDVRVAAAAGEVRLEVDADPGAGVIALRDIGLMVRTVRPGLRLVRRSRTALLVRGSLGADGAGLVLRLRAGSRVLRVARAGADGRYRLGIRGRLPAAVALEVPGDRTRLGLRVPLPRRQLDTKRA